MVDVAQPSLDRLAEESHKLVRLAIVDGRTLVFVAQAQGATRGSATTRTSACRCRSRAAPPATPGSTMSDEEALAAVAAQGFARPDNFGSRAPTTVKGLLGYVRAARNAATASSARCRAGNVGNVAAVVSRGVALGVVTIAGPLVRLTEERMANLGEPLLATAAEIAGLSAASSLFRRSA